MDSKLRLIVQRRADAVASGVTKLTNEHAARGILRSSATMDRSWEIALDAGERARDEMVDAFLNVGIKDDAVISNFVGAEFSSFLQSHMMSTFGRGGPFGARAVVNYSARAQQYASRTDDIVRSRRHDIERASDRITSDSEVKIAHEYAFSIDDLLSKVSFLKNAVMRGIVERDLGELRAALLSGTSKTLLLLCGSILEGVLVDAVARNIIVAKTYQPKKHFPDDYSLHDLIDVAVEEQLLRKSTRNMASSVTEHRDLIHPAAEARGDVQVDAARASAMMAFLAVIVGELSSADGGAAMAAYEQK